MGVSLGDFGRNLLILSLDVIKPVLPLLKAPDLTPADEEPLRSWTRHWNDFDGFPYIETTPFSATIAALERSLPAGRSDAILDWARRSCPICDPSLERPDIPAFAARQWVDALKSACKFDVLPTIALSDSGSRTVHALLMAFDDRTKPVVAFAESLRKEWEAYPDDPGQWRYNLASKTPWDRYVYENCSQKWSFDLSFDLAFIARDQATHHFVRAYATQLSPADHAAIRENLANALEFRDPHPGFANDIARLRNSANYPLEWLVKFTQEPL